MQATSNLDGFLIPFLVSDSRLDVMLTRLVMREVRRALLYIRAFVSTNNHNNTSKDEATFSR
jgi:hypothetical protein